MKRVFVYGSLLSGLSNHRVLLGARPCGAIRTVPRFSLRDLGAFPALVAVGETPVIGEAYEVWSDLLERLDRFEGCPSYYYRAAIELADGTFADAYLQRPSQVIGSSKIESGDWRSHYRRVLLPDGRTFEGSALDVVSQMKSLAFFVEALSLRDYIDWVAQNLLDLHAVALAVEGDDDGARAGSLIDGMVRVGVAVDLEASS